MDVEPDYVDKFTFLCEMYDTDRDEIRQIILNFYPYDNAVQVIDAHKGKQLLKRIQYPKINLKMLKVGNTVNVFSKLLLIKDYSEATQNKLSKYEQRSFILIKPVSSYLHGKILTFIINHGFRITKMKSARLTLDDSKKLYEKVQVIGKMPDIIDYIRSGDVVGLEVVAPNAIESWRDLLGHTDPAKANPYTLRAKYGENIIRNVAHSCKSHEEAKENLEHFFGYGNDGKPYVPIKATCTKCTCCIILPHVIADGNLGAIFEHISETNKFIIAAIGMFAVDLCDAREFFEVYKGVLPEYDDMSIHLAEEKCIVLEIKCQDESLDPVSEFRKVCGPRNPEVCRQLYPDTIRALYGKDIVHNAVHCTDLPEDGEAEVEYFFHFISNDKRV